LKQLIGLAPKTPTKRIVMGYAHTNYAASLAEFGSPLLLSASGGWILERSIPGTLHRDAMGCYPLFSCADWSRLPEDIESLSEELVSLVLVTDPFGDYTEEGLSHTFKDLVVPFKEHFVVDLAVAPETFLHSHHRRNARKALEVVSVEECSAADSIHEWLNLYANLVTRHDIRGIARFSQASFALQSKVPGAVMLRAIHEGRTVGMTWWFVSGGVGYYHLGAFSDEGYQQRASFALFWRALELFRADGLRWLDLGAGAGVANGAQDGLSRFKRGWSNGTRMAYLCGRIFDRSRYEQIAEAKGTQTTDYFPAYRQGEFV
jgi:hypothetical protein